MPIWDGKIDGVVKDVADLKKEVGTFRTEVDARLKRLESQTKGKNNSPN